MSVPTATMATKSPGKEIAMATTAPTNPFTLPCVDEQTYTAHATGGTYRITLIRGGWAGEGEDRTWRPTQFAVTHINSGTPVATTDQLYQAARAAEDFARTAEAAVGYAIDRIPTDDLAIGDTIVYPAWQNGTVVDRLETITGFDESYPQTRGVYFGPRSSGLLSRTGTARKVAAAR
jgi:hypothetical protein